MNSRRKIPRVDGCVDLVEQGGHPACPEQGHVVDDIRSGTHPADDRGQFPDRVRRTRGHPRGGEVDMGVDQLRQAGLFGESEDRDQPLPPTRDWVRRTCLGSLLGEE
ncbi:hypothetical protein ROP_72360 [Rhodococcus opacus B4]|uniref:Uncharacterized protein n=1 Tax=Rhodococcus opacus (strain B4) TaxID=632772 RepID=C1B672_RHOOB|nr:hypothetical protein ROP_72360 [Rhodococcus opacus B4]